MDSIDLERVRQRTRIAYELGRIRRAALGSLPLLLIIVVATWIAVRPASTLVFGLAAALFSMLMLWYGRSPQKAVLPGIAAGLIPLLLAVCANQMHTCGPDGCRSWCVPACCLGGGLAGLAVAAVARQRGGGVAFWLSASLLALLTGAMGCSCVGFSGVVGLSVGFSGGLVPHTMRRLFARPS